jgi:hypothetical protein
LHNKNWFSRHETDRFLNNHCQEWVRAYLSIHDCLSFLHEVMIGNHRTKTFLHKLSDNLPERVQILCHVHIICINVRENRIICCQIFCNLLLKSAFERIFNVMQLILVKNKWHIKWKYLSVYHIRIIAKKNWFTTWNTDSSIIIVRNVCVLNSASMIVYLFFWVKKIFPWKFNLEYGGTFTKLFMHVSSRNVFPTTRNLQIRVHVYRDINIIANEKVKTFSIIN